MRSMIVKDVSSAFLNQPVSAAGKTAGSAGSFQQVWSGQMNKGASDTAAQGTVQKQGKADGQQKGSPTEDSVVRNNVEDQSVQPKDQEAVSGMQEREETVSEMQDQEETVSGMEEREIVVSGDHGTVAEPELTEEQLQAMETLVTAAMRLMEQIADVFGVNMEELQAVMDSLEMNQADLLDASKLGSLLLQLGGAQDAYALLTDSGLYDNYQTIMNQMNQMIQENARELGTDAEQLPEFFKDGFDRLQVLAKESVPTELVQDRSEGLEEDGALTEREDSSLYPETVDVVQEEQAQTKQDTGAQARNGKQPESKADRGDHLNLFTQDLRAGQFRPELQQTQEISQSPWSSDTRQIMEQILDYMKVSLNADTTNLEMQLHPASLGTLQIQIASKGGVVTANFIAQNEGVKAALESQMLQLREQFEERGVKVEAIEVTVQTHEFEQNLEQGRGRSGQETEKRGRSRRINVSGVFQADDPEADEGTAADMATVGGSTVSYTA